MRTLRSKFDRNKIYFAYDGKCAMCLCDLPNDWQADHIIPYSVCKTTDLSNMQPLCISCNLWKGADVLRIHQRQIVELLETIGLEYQKTGILSKKQIVKHAFPGSGKSFDPVLAFKILKKFNIVDKLAWIVPRTSLVSQGEEEFKKKEMKKLFPHDFEIVQANGTANPSKGTNGFITTYNTILIAHKKGNDFNPFIKDFNKYRYLLVLDEVHHTTPKSCSRDNESKEAQNFFQACKPIYDLAAFRLLESGTLYRHINNEKVGFVDYVPKENGSFEPFVDICYDYNDAKNDNAALELNYYNFDVKKISYTKNHYNEDGTKKEEIIKTSFENGTDLLVALQSEYGQKMFDYAVANWQHTRANYNPNAKIIIVAHDQNHCKKYHEQLKHRGIESRLAITDNTEAHKHITEFRRDPKVVALVTCQMAYEGLDCKQASHIVVLTNIRSKSWITQVLTRIIRPDNTPNAIPIQKQRAIAFVPNDPSMIEILESFGAKNLGDVDIDPTIDIIEGLKELDIDKIQQPQIVSVENMESEIGGITHTNNNLVITEDVVEQVKAFQNAKGISGEPIDTYKMLAEFGMLSALNNYSQKIKPSSLEIETTPTERINMLRKRIERFARQLDYNFQVENGTWNKKVFNAFRYQNRKSMSEDELKKVLAWLTNAAKIEKENLIKKLTASTR